MTEDFRQKLLNWACSAILLVAFTALGAVLTWFLIVPNQSFSWGAPTTMAGTAGPLGGNLVLYPILFAPIAFWHLFDFFQTGHPVSSPAQFFSSYAPFAFTISAAGAALVLLLLGFFIDSCPPSEVQPVNSFPRTCYSAWSKVLGVTLLLSITLLCMGKAVTALRTRLK